MNRYQPQSSGEVEQIEVRRIDNSEVRAQQIAQLDLVRNSRNEKMVAEALVELKRAASGSDNLMPFAIEAARQRATVGEMSDAMASEFGRHQATIKGVRGVWKHHMKASADLELLKEPC